MIVKSKDIVTKRDITMYSDGKLLIGEVKEALEFRPIDPGELEAPTVTLQGRELGLEMLKDRGLRLVTMSLKVSSPRMYF